MAITRVTTDGITDSAVSTAKIGANAVDTTKIGADVIVADDIADNAITVAQIQDNAITTDKIANSAITDAKIAAMAASKLTGALPALDGSALTSTGMLKHIQHATITGNSSSMHTSTSYVASAVTITVAAADVAKCSTLVIVHYGSTRTDKNSHAHQQREWKRTAPGSTVDYYDLILGSVAGGSESLDNATLLAIDNNLGTGNHTYTVYTRKASGNTTYASNVYDNYRTSQIVVWGY